MNLAVGPGNDMMKKVLSTFVDIPATRSRADPWGGGGCGASGLGFRWGGAFGGPSGWPTVGSFRDRVPIPGPQHHRKLPPTNNVSNGGSNGNVHGGIFEVRNIEGGNIT